MTALSLAVYSDADGYGGAEIVLGTLIESLEPDVEVTVLATSQEVGEKLAARRVGATLRVLPPVRSKFDLKPIWAHLRAVRRLRPDVFHVNLRTPYACQYGLLAALTTPGVAVVANEHLPLASDSAFSRFVKRATSRRLAGHVAVGDATARFVEADAGLAPGSVVTIRNGVPDRGRVGRRGAGGASIGTIGRLDRQKGLDVLIEALTRLPGVRCLVLGDGPDRGALEAEARRQGVAERLELAGWSDEPAARFAELDVFVLPSRYEGFPLVILEAMLAGVPVVATDVGSVREAITHEVDGLLVPPERPEELAAAVRRLLDDPTLRTRLADAARVRAEAEFTAATMARRWRALYDGVRAQRI